MLQNTRCTYMEGNENIFTNEAYQKIYVIFFLAVLRNYANEMLVFGKLK